MPSDDRDPADTAPSIGRRSFLQRAVLLAAAPGLVLGACARGGRRGAAPPSPGARLVMPFVAGDLLPQGGMFLLADAQPLATPNQPVWTMVARMVDGAIREEGVVLFRGGDGRLRAFERASPFLGELIRPLMPAGLRVWDAPRHRCRWRWEDGAPIGGPAREALRAVPVDEREGRVVMALA